MTPVIDYKVILN